MISGREVGGGALIKISLFSSVLSCCWAERLLSAPREGFENPVPPIPPQRAIPAEWQQPGPRGTGMRGGRAEPGSSFLYQPFPRLGGGEGSWLGR